MDVLAANIGHLLSDGFHRMESAKGLGNTQVEAEVKEVGRKDAWSTPSQTMPGTGSH